MVPNSCSTKIQEARTRTNSGESKVLKSLRILQVSPDSYGEVGGVSVHVRNVSERLARRHDVTVYSTNAGSRRPWFELKNGVKVNFYIRWI